MIPIKKYNHELHEPTVSDQREIIYTNYKYAFLVKIHG